MRIIAGKYKGRIITHVAPNGVRPTTDRVRESIFNILSNVLDFEAIRVLDLCAGTGALGLEAISRGAGFCSFVELSKVTSNLLKKTITQLNIKPENYEVVTMDSCLFAKKFSNFTLQSYDLIFVDPPYKNKLINPIFRLINVNQILTSGGFFVAEHDIRETILQIENFEQINKRQFGETVIDIFQLK